MSFLAGLLPTLIVLGILILIHEWGHFIACRLTGVRVDKFSIGFGPEILHFQGKETRYSLSLLPFGGYVKPAGESFSDLGAEGPRPGDYMAAPVGTRIFIVTAGVLMNYVLSFILLAGVFVVGRPIPLAQIGGFVEGYPAISSGLEKGDRIVSVEGIAVNSWSDLTQTLTEVQKEEVQLEFTRQERLKKLRLAVRIEPVEDIFGKTHSMARLGITPDPEAVRIEKLPAGKAIREAFVTEWYLAGLTYKALYYLATGRLSLKTVSGPIGIMTMTGTAAKMGLVYVLHLTAVLGISLAVINLLPIPALDGGHLVFLLIEMLRGRSVSPKVQERATQIGFFLLILLMVLVLYNDLLNLQVFDRVKEMLGR